MQAGDLLFGRRIRQNHSLEHATVTMLARALPRLAVSARSNTRGFTIFADLDVPLVERCCHEALARLRSGESHLAIHPNCGTNLAVGVSLVTLGTMLGFASNHPRTRVVAAAASSLTGLAAARPLGELVQKYVTTLPDLKGVRVTEIFRRKLFGFTVVEVRTVQE